MNSEQFCAQRLLPGGRAHRSPAQFDGEITAALSRGARNSAPKRATGGVHYLVVDYQGEIQDVLDADLAVDDSRALAHSSDHDVEERQGKGRDAEAAATGEHAHGSHGDGTDALPGRDRSGHHSAHGR
jgi:hypothetical protein